MDDPQDPILDSIMDAEDEALSVSDSDLSLLLAAGPARGLALAATHGDHFRPMAELREEPGLDAEALGGRQGA